MRSVPADTFEETGASDESTITLLQSNSEAEKNAKYAETKRIIQSASGSSYETLLAHIEVGAKLKEIKGLTTHGNFLREVEERLGIKKAWCARLQKLYEKSPYILIAIEWAKANDRLECSEYSVNGAFKLLEDWVCATGANISSSTTSSRRNGQATKSCKGEKAEEIKIFDCGRYVFFLLDLLAEAADHIEFLQAEIARLLDLDVPPAGQFVLPLALTSSPEETR